MSLQIDGLHKAFGAVVALDGLTFEVPAGEIYVYSEGANGELGFHIVSNGTGKPYTIQVRAPGFPILSALPRLIKGHAVADIIPVFDSINMIGGEVEQ